MLSVEVEESIVLSSDDKSNDNTADGKHMTQTMTMQQMV